MAVEGIIYPNDWAVTDSGELIPVAPDFGAVEYEHWAWLAPAIAGVVAAGGTIASVAINDKNRDAARAAQKKQAEIDKAYLEEQAALQEKQLKIQQQVLASTQNHELDLSADKKQMVMIIGAIILGLAGLFFTYKKLF